MESAMTDARDDLVRIGTAGVPAYVAIPDGPGPWPGVVIVHDALGMTSDLRDQADWLAGEGYLAAAPDLYHRSGRLRCMFRTLRAAVRGEGDAFDDLDATRDWLTSRPDCTGRIGVVGFCMGGGFALLLASGWGYDASAVNYGGLPDDVEEYLVGACPVVASYGGRDPTLRRAPAELEAALTANQIDHDVEVYPDAGHGFINQHARAETPPWALVMGALSRTRYDEQAALDARRRIVAFFGHHLAT
jgi:carboxymethylenebutenolidase